MSAYRKADDAPCYPDHDHARSWQTWMKARELLAYAAGVLKECSRNGLADEITAFLKDTRNAGSGR